LGSSGPGLELLEALRADPKVELAAVSEASQRLAERGRADSIESHYDDHRQLIVESASTGIEAVFMALPAFEAEEYLPVAAGRGLAVFVVPPFSRTFDTTVELAGRFSAKRCPIVVARTWAVESPALAGSQVVEQAGHIFAADGRVSEPTVDVQGWRGDSHRAGGGVLLHGGYEMVDAIVTLMGVPDAVFCATSAAAGPKQVRTYDTEDAAAATFRYADSRVATLACRRAETEPVWGLTLLGTQATLSVTRPAKAPSNRFGPSVSLFLQALASQASPVPSQITEHLGTMATISAAYLSVRTGQVESPHKFLELAAVERR
jgi:predicted dehydrogenase